MHVPQNIESLQTTTELINHVRQQLHNEPAPSEPSAPASRGLGRGSVVLLPITQTPHRPIEKGLAPVLIFNKRSQKVRQPGDLCYPGGSIAAGDRLLALLLQMLLPTLTRRLEKKNGYTAAIKKPVVAGRYLATGLREAWEEMGLNPLRCTFLGALPDERLVMFDRRIHPLVVWVGSQRRYKPNWEVERIVYVPLAAFFNQANYALYRPCYNGRPVDERGAFPCFLHHGQRGREILWGVSYRMTMRFLDRVFGFTPPRPRSLPLIEGHLTPDYLKGVRRRKKGWF